MNQAANESTSEQVEQLQYKYFSLISNKCVCVQTVSGKQKKSFKEEMKRIA